MIVFIEERETLLDLLEVSEFSTYIVRLLIEEILEAESRLQLFLSGGALQRVARVLLTLPASRDAMGKRRLKLTNEMLAAVIGTSTETASSCLGRLQDRGLIARGRGHITILEPDGMRIFF